MLVVRLFIVILLLGAVFGGIFGWKYYQMQQGAAQQGGPPPPTVAIHTVEADDWRPELQAIGTLVAAKGTNVTGEVPGIVREIHFESGQAVAQGDLLVQLDDAVDQAELAGLLAEQHLAELKYRRLSRLVTDQSVSEADVDEARAQLDSATAQVGAKRAVIAKKKIRAPFAGRLGIRLVDIGDYLEPGVPIVPLEALDPIYVDFSLPERHLARVEEGQPVEVRASARPDETFSGEVSAINPAVDVATRSLKLRATLANPEGRLRPGMFVETFVKLPQRQDIVTIPRVAVTYAPYGDSVFVVEDKDGQLTVERRQIETGAVRPGETEVVEGLEPGERIVLAGQVKLRNGQTVREDNEVVPSGGEPGK